MYYLSMFDSKGYAHAKPVRAVRLTKATRGLWTGKTYDTKAEALAALKAL